MSREKLVSVAFLSSIIPYFGHFQTSSVSYYLTFCLIPLYLFLLRGALSDKDRAKAVCLLFMMPLVSLAHPFIFAYLACFSLLLACSSKVLKPGFIRNILSLNFLFPDALRSAGRKVPVFILLTFTSGFLLCAKCAPQFFVQFFDIFISNPILRAKTLVAAGFSTVPGMENGFLEFVYLLNLYYGKYYIPLILL